MLCMLIILKQQIMSNRKLVEKSTTRGEKLSEWNENNIYIDYVIKISHQFQWFDTKSKSWGGNSQKFVNYSKFGLYWPTGIKLVHCNNRVTWKEKLQQHVVSVHEDVYTLVQNVTIKQHNRKVFNNMCHQFIKVLYTLVLNVTIEQHQKNPLEHVVSVHEGVYIILLY